MTGVNTEAGGIPDRGAAEIPFNLITPAHVRASVRRAKRSLEDAATEIIWQIEMESWRTLGYRSWSAMREAEYGGAAFMVPSKSRPELVARIKEIEVGRTARGGVKHLTNQEIADTVGVSEPQVRRDLSGDKTAQLSGFVDGDDDVVDAELVDDEDAKTGPVAADPAPITVACPTCGGTGKVTR